MDHESDANKIYNQNIITFECSVIYCNYIRMINVHSELIAMFHRLRKKTNPEYH